MSSTVLRVTLAIAIGAAVVHARAAQDDPEDLIGLARQALGGEARIASIKSFMATGNVSWTFSDRQPDTKYGAFEINAVLPDKFMEWALSNDSFLGEGVTTRHGNGAASTDPEITKLGFNGSHVIAEGNGLYDLRDRSAKYGPQFLPPPKQEDLDAKYLTRAQDASLDLTLGLLVAAMPSVPAEFRRNPNPVRPSVLVLGPGYYGAAQLVFDPVTHLAARFNDIVYSNYREVDGLKVPFKMTRGNETREVKSFKLNVEIPDKTFRPSGM